MSDPTESRDAASEVAGKADSEVNGKEPGFDATLSALKQVVDRLESGQLSLEAALAAFEDGVRLARKGAQILDAAERRVEILTKGDAESGARVAPFADAEGG